MTQQIFCYQGLQGVLKETYESARQTMLNGPCGPARAMAGEAEPAMVASLWNGLNARTLYDLFLDYSEDWGAKAVPMFVFFPYPFDVQSYWAERKFAEANDALYCFLVRIVDQIVLMDEINYPAGAITDPYSKQYYFRIQNRMTFLLCFTKTIDWVGRYMDCESFGCLVVQDHAMFPGKAVMEKLRPVIRNDKNNLAKCPFSGKSAIAYPQEMPLGAEFSEMHITRRDELSRDSTHPDDRWFYKQLPGSGEFAELELSDLQKISKEDFQLLLKE